MSPTAWIGRLSWSARWQFGLVLVSLIISATYAMLAYLFAPEVSVIDGFHRCDSFWYESIAVNGYPWSAPGSDLGHARGADVHQTPWGFFPLYPWTIASLAHLTGLEIRHAMFALAWLLSALLPLVMYRCFLAYSDEQRAGWASLAMLCFPFGIYAHLHMTEALYAMALMGAFLAAAERKPLLLAFAASALVLVRPNGAIMLLPILLVIIDRAGIPLRKLFTERERALRVIWPLAFPVLAVAGYCWYQWQMTGTPFAFMEAERGWGRHFTWPFMGFFRSGEIATQFESWYAIGLIIVVAVVGRKLPASLHVLIWLGIVFPLCSGTVSDMMRYSSVMFPLFLVIGTSFMKSRWRSQLLILSVALQFGWFWVWLAMIGGWLAC